MQAKLRLAIVVLCVGLAAGVAASEESEFVSKVAKDGQVAYKEALRKVEENRVADLIAAKKAYYKALSDAYLEALKANDKDQQQVLLAIRKALWDEIKALETDLETLKAADPAVRAEAEEAYATSQRLKKLKVAAAERERQKAIDAITGKWRTDKGDVWTFTRDGKQKSSKNWGQSWHHVEGRLYKLASGSELIMSKDGTKMLFKSSSGHGKMLLVKK